LSPITDSGASPLRSLAGQYSGLAALAGIQVGENGQRAANIAVLKSRMFLEGFIESHALLPVLFHERWDAAAGAWRLTGTRPPPSLQDAYSLFIKKILSVNEDKASNLLTVRIDWRDAQQAADWANGLVTSVNEVARRRAVEEAERSMEFLGKELERTQAVEVRQSIYSLLELQISKRMAANTRPDFAFSVIDPAQVPQPTNFVWPNPLVLTAIGFVVGGASAAAAILALAFVREWRRRSQYTQSS
jgi:uncharacterized protein involved in exopolysaccharide biosynthesis